MAIVKSKLLKQVSDNWPNFFRKDLDKIFSIIVNEIKDALKRGDAVELRGVGRFSTRIQKESIRRNPRTNEKVAVKKKKKIHWKMSKEMFKNLNNEK